MPTEAALVRPVRPSRTGGRRAWRRRLASRQGEERAEERIHPVFLLDEARLLTKTPSSICTSKPAPLDQLERDLTVAHRRGSRAVDLEAAQLAAQIRFRASDRFGNPAPIQTRCWTHHPLAAPLHVYAAAAAGASDGAAVNALGALTLGSPDDDAEIVQLLNGTSAGASIMKVRIANGTPEAVYLTLEQIAPTSPLPQYERDWVITNGKTGDGAVDRACGCTQSAGGGNCNPTAMPASTSTNGPSSPLSVMSSSSRLNLKVRLFDTTGGSPVEVLPSAGRYLVSPRVRERARLREQRRDGAGYVMVEAVDAIVAGDRRRSGSLG